MRWIINHICLLFCKHDFEHLQKVRVHSENKDLTGCEMEIDIERLADDFLNNRVTILCENDEERYKATVMLLDGGVKHGNSGVSVTIVGRDKGYGGMWRVLFCSNGGIEYCTADSAKAKNMACFQNLPALYPVLCTQFETDESLFGEFFHVAQNT